MPGKHCDSNNSQGRQKSEKTKSPGRKCSRIAHLNQMGRCLQKHRKRTNPSHEINPGKSPEFNPSDGLKNFNSLQPWIRPSAFDDSFQQNRISFIGFETIKDKRQRKRCQSNQCQALVSMTPADFCIQHFHQRRKKHDADSCGGISKRHGNAQETLEPAAQQCRQ